MTLTAAVWASADPLSSKSAMATGHFWVQLSYGPTTRARLA
jgi:hypothetical protein